MLKNKSFARPLHVFRFRFSLSFHDTAPRHYGISRHALVLRVKIPLISEHTERKRERESRGEEKGDERVSTPFRLNLSVSNKKKKKKTSLSLFRSPRDL